MLSKFRVCMYVRMYVCMYVCHEMMQRNNSKTVWDIQMISGGFSKQKAGYPMV